MSRADWVLAIAEGVSPEEPRAHVWCSRCGERMVHSLPQRIETFVKVSRAFVSAHKKCVPVVRGGMPSPPKEERKP